MYWNLHDYAWVDETANMNKASKTWFIALPVALSFFFSFSPLEAGKKDPSTIKNEIDQERLHLEQLNQEIAETKRKASQAKKKHGSVLKNIESLDRRLYRQKEEQTRLNQQIKEIDQELANLQTRISQLEEHIQQNQESVSARLRVLYVEGRVGYLKTLFSADSLASAFQRMDFISWVAQREGELVRQFKEDMVQVQNLKERQSQARDSLLGLQEKTQRNIQDISGLKRKKRTVLVRLSKEKDTHERTVEDLERSAEQVDKILQALDQRFQLAQSRSRTIPGKLPSVGSFLWPVQGKIVSFFGRQKHPTFDTYVNKKGIEIQAREGSPIHSVSSGKVVYADWLKGYGLVVIVDHTNGFYSLYAHASKLFVKEGQSVTRGSPLGETGETGATEDQTLYFELRKGTTPIDPIKWLTKQP